MPLEVGIRVSGDDERLCFSSQIMTGLFLIHLGVRPLRHCKQPTHRLSEGKWCSLRLDKCSEVANSGKGQAKRRNDFAQLVESCAVINVKAKATEVHDGIAVVRDQQLLTFFGNVKNDG